VHGDHVSGCDGSCCAAFYLPLTIRQIRRGEGTRPRTRLADHEYIADMLVPLTPKEATERAARFAREPDLVQHRWSNRGHHFACRHWDEETRLCTAYEERPHFCRAHPNDGPGSCAWGCDEPGTPMDEAIAAARKVRPVA
jgi:Fe-S-cluster containining protein